MVLDRTLDIRDGAVRFRVLAGGRGPHLVYFHSFRERGGWSPFLDHLAARYTVLAPFHPGVQARAASRRSTTSSTSPSPTTSSSTGSVSALPTWSATSLAAWSPRSSPRRFARGRRSSL